jgi:hypothetical protein
MAVLMLYTEAGDLVAMLGSMTIVGIVLWPLMRAWARRIEGKVSTPPAVSAATDARLERMEQAIEAVAVEVERISEAQRFQTRLLAERTGSAPMLEGRKS